MLDDQLPTYLYKPSDNPLSSVLYFTHQGSEPCPVHLLRRPDPSASRNAYALALADAGFPDVIFAEVLVRPEFAQPTLSAADINNNNNTTTTQRRRRTGSGTQSPPDGLLVPVVPDTVVLRLYNPDQNVGVKMLPGSWGRTDAWEFEMPERTFRLPSASRIDQHADAAGADVVDFAPKVTFRWKRDGRLSKDMTCYMTGKSVAGKKSKEPDITVAMYKGGKNESVMVYEPNLQRVDVQDRKGLEVVLLLGAAVIRDLYIANNIKADPFNTAAAAASASPPTMSGAITAAAAAASSLPSSLPSPPRVGSAAYDAEARRQRERDRRDAQEQQRIRMMLEKEERERQRRDAEVAAETERLKKLYGTQGQAYASSSPPPPAPPPRPSAGTSSSSGNPSASASGPSRWFSRDSLGLVYNGVAGASSSVFFGRGGDDAAGKKLQKKKSMVW